MTAQNINFSRLLHLTTDGWRQGPDYCLKDSGLSMSRRMAVATPVDCLVGQRRVGRSQPLQDQRKRLLFITPTGNHWYKTLRSEASMPGQRRRPVSAYRNELNTIEKMLKQLPATNENK